MAYIVGFFVGMGVMLITQLIDRKRCKTKRIIELEKEYDVLQQHVDGAVDAIERIIHGSKL